MTARDNLIAATVQALRLHGGASAGLSEIVEASGRSRRSVYLSFPGGKSQMVLAATEFAGEAMAQAIATLAQGSSPDVAIATFVDQWIAMLESSDYRAGCPVVAAALSRHEAPEAADAAGDVFGRWQEILAEELVRAGAEAVAASDVAATAVAAIEGAVVWCQASRDSAPLRQVEASLQRLVRVIVPSSDAR